LGDKLAPSAAEVAARLGVTETALYSAIHRLRRRYGEVLRREVAHTVARPEEIEEELRYLVRVLSS
jgi:RNA polymerase sigma-70 factor (ECF subfamily)